MSLEPSSRSHLSRVNEKPSVEHTKGLQMDAFQSVLRMKRREEGDFPDLDAD